MRHRLIISFGLLLAMAQPVMADDCESPCVATTMSIESSFNWNFAAQDPRLEVSSLQPDLEVESYLRPFDGLKLVNVSRFEEVADPRSGQSTAFDRLGGYVAALYLEAAFEPLTVQAGKFEPVFSLAGAEADGINSADLAGNVDSGESLGASVAMAFETAGLSQVLTASIFAPDRSLLAHSVFTPRDVLHVRDGGAGNGTWPSSLSLVLDGCMDADPADCHSDGSFGYRLGVRYRKHGRQTEEQADDEILPRDEFAALGAGLANFDVGDHQLRLTGEAAWIKHVDGGPENAVLLTGVLAYEAGPFTVSGSASQQWSQVAADADSFERLFEVALTYTHEDLDALPNSTFTFGAAYNYRIDEDSIAAHVLSLQGSLDFGGSASLR